MADYNEQQFTIIIFGASGDLTQRKLAPGFISPTRDRRVARTLSVLCIRTFESDRRIISDVVVRRRY